MADLQATGKAPDASEEPETTLLVGQDTSGDIEAARRAIIVSAWLLGLLILGSVLIYGRNVLIPLAVAILIWHMINAIAARYGRLKLGPIRLPEPICLLLALLTILTGCWLVVDIVGNNVAQVRDSAPVYQENLRKLAADLPAWVGLEGTPTIEQLTSRLNIAALIGTLTSSFGALIGNTGLVAIYVMFLLFEQASFDRKIDALFPDGRKAQQVREVLSATEHRIERYLWVKTLTSLLTAGLCYAVLTFVGVDYPGFWALTVFLFNFIPNVGSVIAVILPCILALLQFGNPTTAIVLAITLSGIQFFVGSFIEPRFMGTSLNLSPIVIMLSLTLWGSIWGLAGMVLCVPMTAIMAILCSQFKVTRPIAVILSSDGKIG